MPSSPRVLAARRVRGAVVAQENTNDKNRFPTTALGNDTEASKGRVPHKAVRFAPADFRERRTRKTIQQRPVVLNSFQDLPIGSLVVTVILESCNDKNRFPATTLGNDDKKTIVFGNDTDTANN